MTPSQAAIADAKRNRLTDVYAAVKAAAKERQGTRNDLTPNFQQLIAGSEVKKPAPQTRDIRAKAAGTNRTYIDNIKSLISQEAICTLNFEETSEDIPGPNGGSRRSPLYLLDFDATMTLITAPNFGVSEYKDAKRDIKTS